MTERAVRLTDRYGVSSSDDVTIDRLADLLGAIEVPDGDDEHATVSLTDEDAWNLAFSRTSVLFENVEGDEVGVLRDLTRDERLAIGAEFLAGDFEALRARAWSP